MRDPVSHIARASAERISSQFGQDIIDEVNTAIYATRRTAEPQQYFDPVSLGSLVVSIAALTWAVYTDLKDKAIPPSPELMQKNIQIRLHDRQGPDATLGTTDRVIEIVIDETLKTAAHHFPPTLD